MRKIKNVFTGVLSGTLSAVSVMLAYIIGISIVVIATLIMAVIIVPIDALSFVIKYGDSFSEEYCGLMNAYFSGIKEGFEYLGI